MVSARDREHFRRIAAVKEAHVRYSIQRAAGRDPSANVEAAFAWSEFAAAVGTRRPKQKVPPVRLWRELQRRRT